MRKSADAFVTASNGATCRAASISGEGFAVPFEPFDTTVFDLMASVSQQMAGLRQLIEQGAVVAATDYPGLGTTGPHPYLVGDSEARAVIDSVRAAHNLPGAETGNSFAVWGHSQGGQASLFDDLDDLLVSADALEVAAPLSLSSQSCTP